MSLLELVFIILFLPLFGISSIIHVPTEQSTIQAGIDAASNGDTVLADTGNYAENINFNGKNIVVGSLFITTGDTSFIAQTVIDGNHNGNVVRFENGENASAVLCGFTVTNGNAGDGEGGGIRCTESSPTLSDLIILKNNAIWGSGIYCARGSNPKITNIKVSGNSSGLGGGIHCYSNSSPTITNADIRDNSASSGGGIYCRINSSPNLTNVIIKGNIASAKVEFEGGGGMFCWDNSHPILSKTTISENTAERGGGVYFRYKSDLIFDIYDRSNIYQNTAKLGADFFSKDCSSINVVLDTFTVISPTSYYALPRCAFSFDIRNALIELVNSDLYVAPNGDNDNSGLTPDDPFRTIDFALSRIYTDSLNPHTIYLAEGTYSTSTNGESYPLNCFTNISGAGECKTILDAEGESGVLSCYYASNIKIQDVKIQNGYATDGGGIYCYQSSPFISRVTITECNVGRYGGGIYCRLGSNLTLTNVTISGNSAGTGGGIYCSSSNTNLTNVTISDNFSWWDGGGIFFSVCNPTLINVTICKNYSIPHVIYNGGGIFCYKSNPIIVNSTIVDNSPGNNGGAIYCKNGSHPFMINTISWNNTSQEIYFHPFQEGLSANSITIAYSDMQGGETAIVTNNNGLINWLEGNIDTDPLFVNPENYDFNLKESSPCIDAGTTFFVWESDTLVNLDSTEYVGSAPDMGAFESPHGVGTEEKKLLPNKFALYQNYPNPFMLTTAIKFVLPKELQVTLKVYDIGGRLVSTLINDKLEAGQHTVNWNPKEPLQGIYFYKISIRTSLETDDHTRTKKMILLK